MGTYKINFEGWGTQLTSPRVRPPTWQHCPDTPLAAAQPINKSINATTGKPHQSGPTAADPPLAGPVIANAGRYLYLTALITTLRSSLRLLPRVDKLPKGLTMACCQERPRRRFALLEKVSLSCF